jgi:hypothetical protein
LLALSSITGWGRKFKDDEMAAAVLQALRDYHQSRRHTAKADALREKRRASASGD